LRGSIVGAADIENAAAGEELCIDIAKLFSLPNFPQGERARNQSPPILQTIFHSSAVTGCTDSREYFTSAISASFLSALIAAIVTSVFRGFGSSGVAYEMEPLETIVLLKSIENGHSNTDFQ
jgi:hypothetical protein